MVVVFQMIIASVSWIRSFLISQRRFYGFWPEGQLSRGHNKKSVRGCSVNLKNLIKSKNHTKMVARFKRILYFYTVIMYAGLMILRLAFSTTFVKK